MNTSSALKSRRLATLISKLNAEDGGSMVEKILITLIALGGMVVLGVVINHATSTVKDRVNEITSESQETQEMSDGVN